LEAAEVHEHVAEALGVAGGVAQHLETLSTLMVRDQYREPLGAPRPLTPLGAKTQREAEERRQHARRPPKTGQAGADERHSRPFRVTLRMCTEPCSTSWSFSGKRSCRRRSSAPLATFAESSRAARRASR